jgi:hypothetical protein
MSLPHEEHWGLIDLIDQLRHDRFNIGTEQYVAAMKVAALLSLRGELRDQPEKLGAFLGPILCASAEQQANFPKYFERWVASNSSVFAAEKPIARQPLSSTSTARVAVKKARRKFRPPLRWVWAGLLVLVLSGVSLVSFYLQRPTQHTLTIRVDNPDAPITVEFTPQSSTPQQWTGKQNITFTYSSNDLPAELDIKQQGINIFITKIETPLEGILTLYPERLASSPLHYVQRPTRGNWSSVLRISSWVSLGVLLLLCLFIALSRIRKSRRQLELRKERTSQNLKTQPLSVKGASEQLTQLLSLRRTAQELRRYRSFESRDLEINQTINETLCRGLFTPSYTPRKSSPEYLVLIDRTSLDDQRARLATEIMDRLTKHGVFVTTYYFQGDPRLCQSPGGPEGNLILSELAARHPDHTLMIFGEGTELFEPFGSPYQWVEMFSPWSARFLLSFDIRRGDYREWSLRQMGFDVVPADGKGMMTLTEIIHEGARRPGSEPPPVKPLPELLRTRQSRWTEEHPPSMEVLKELCSQLRGFLGDEGIYWLSACAVYPKLYWDLTLYLGYKLIDSEGFDRKFSTLLRLPWFRYGSMPDWLREPLVASLPREKERGVRNALEELLISSLENPDGFILPIASKADELGAKSSNETLRRRLRTPWQRRKAAQEQLRREAGETPFRDYVLVDFLNGRRRNKLATAVPSEIRELLYPQKPRDTSRTKHEVVTPKVSLPESQLLEKPRRPARLWLLALGWLAIPVVAFLMGVRSIQLAGYYSTFVFAGILLLLLSLVRLPQVYGDVEPPLSIMQRLTMVFYAPSRVFRNLRAHPKWLVGLMAIGIFTGIYNEAFVRRLTPERIVEHSLQKLAERGVPPDASETQRGPLLALWQQPQQRLVVFASGFVGPFILYSLVAALCLLGVRLFRSRINFWQALSAVIYAALPVVIISKGLSLVILFIKNPEDISPILGMQTLVTDNLGLVFSPSEHPVLYMIGTSFGLLSFYGLWLRARALAKAGYSVTPAASWGASILIWTLSLLCSMLLALLVPNSLS